MLDLGSGAGADVLISARRVGASGKAIGLDMTDEMLALARANAAAAGVENVEFLQGYLEDIPLPDGSVDVIISNCVINLAADKRIVLAEAARVLRPGGRFAVSDVIADEGMDDATRADMPSGPAASPARLPKQSSARHSPTSASSTSRSSPTHRVHEHAGSAIVRRQQALTIDRPNRDDPGSAFGPLSALKQGQIGLKADPERLTDSPRFRAICRRFLVLTDPAEPLAMQKVDESSGRLGLRVARGGPWGTTPPMTSTGAVQADLPLTTAQELPGAQIAENLGLCFGLIVRSMGFAKGFTASFSALRSGEVSQYTEVLEDSRRHAVDRMIANAHVLGADAIIAVRFDSSEMGQNLTEILAYGTAVKLAR